LRWKERNLELGKKGMYTRYWWESQKERDHQVGLQIGGMIILKRILEKQDEIL
jgi:hypothetical protein